MPGCSSLPRSCSFLGLRPVAAPSLALSPNSGSK
jgi:hypothetical protein